MCCIPERTITCCVRASIIGLGRLRLLGFFPGYDRELVAPGVVKRVYQAVYAKLLAPEDKVLRPDPKNMTPRTKRLYELLFPD